MYKVEMLITYLSASNAAICPPAAPAMALIAPSHALLWKNSLMEDTGTMSWNPELEFRMILKIEENPLHEKRSTNRMNDQNLDTFTL